MSASCTRASWCVGMRMALVGVPENHGGVGLHVARGWVGDDAASPTGPPRVVGVRYKPRRGEALVVNYCPWCGGRIRFDEEEQRENANLRGGS